MCAKKLRYSEILKSDDSEESIKGGGQSLEEILRDGSIPDDQIVRILRARMTWKDWLRYDFLRYWFAMAAFAFNTFLVLGIAYTYQVSDILGAVGLATIFAGMCIAEYLLYRRIWPQGILTMKGRSQDYQK